MGAAPKTVGADRDALQSSDWLAEPDRVASVAPGWRVTLPLA